MLARVFPGNILNGVWGACRSVNAPSVVCFVRVQLLTLDLD